MVFTRSGVSAGLLIAVFVVAALGCATAGTPKQIGPNDMAMLAGTWGGNLSTPGAQTQTGSLQIMPDGQYTARAGAFMAQGKATIKDGQLELVPTMTTGGPTAPRSSTATLSERGGVMFLTGYGHSDRGVPYNFEVSKSK